MKHFGLLFFSLLPACGYHLQTSESVFFKEHHIEKVYVAPTQNSTDKVGLEHSVYNALLKEILSQGSVKIVSDPKEADATLNSTVVTAQFGPSATDRADTVSSLGHPNKRISSQYRADLKCTYTLTQRTQKVLWSNTYTRSKHFPAGNELGTLGYTAALINDSNFDQTLGELIERMSEDAYEGMTAAF